MKGQLVVTQKDHPCGRCGKVLPAGSPAWEVPVRTSTPNKWGNERQITVLVRYHQKCWEAKQG